MTILYNQTGQVSLLCDSCNKQTGFYDTLDELLNAVYFNAPIENNDYGSSSWIYGPGRKIIGAGFQPVVTVDITKQVCASCKGAYEGLVYKSAQIGVSPGAKLGHLGQPNRTSAAEDAQATNPTEEFVSKNSSNKKIFPRIFPISEPDISHDQSEQPYGYPE